MNAKLRGEMEFGRAMSAQAHHNSLKREIDTLTDEQHDCLSVICALRHNLHCLSSARIVNTDGGGMELEKAEGLQESINYHIKENFGEDKIINFVEVESLIFEWYECFGDEQKKEYKDDVDYWIDECIIRADRTKEVWNNEVESFLRCIDEEHGTSYTPNGAFRVV